MSRWWNRRRKRAEGYQPTGDSVSWEVCMSQAITALDHSAKLAIESKSSDGLQQVAIGWLAIANTISPGGMEDAEEHDLDASDNNDAYPLGFRAPAPVEDEHEEDEDEFEDHHSFPTSRHRFTR